MQIMNAEWEKVIGYRPKAEGKKRRSGDRENRGKNVFLLCVAFFLFPFFVFPTA
jgi:hypothetical protein